MLATDLRILCLYSPRAVITRMGCCAHLPVGTGDLSADLHIEQETLLWTESTPKSQSDTDVCIHVCMHVYVCICMSACVYAVCLCVYMHICTCMHIHACIYTYVCVFTCMCAYMYMYYMCCVHHIIYINIVWRFGFGLVLRQTFIMEPVVSWDSKSS